MIDALFSRRTLVRTLPSLAALGALPGAGQALAQDTNPPSNPPAGAAAVALGMMVEVVEDRTQLDAAIEQIGPAGITRLVGIIQSLSKQSVVASASK